MWMNEWILWLASTNQLPIAQLHFQGKKYSVRNVPNYQVFRKKSIGIYEKHWGEWVGKANIKKGRDDRKKRKQAETKQ